MVFNIVLFPDPFLRKVAKPHTNFDPQLKQTIADMFETMYQHKGIGLAATQVSIDSRIIVIDVTDDKSQQLVLINPEIIAQEGETGVEEGCLSIPGYNEFIPRFEKVSVKYQDHNGQDLVLDADGILAICIQHEIDHLNGKLFIDYISDMKREMIRKNLTKQKKILARERKNKTQ